MARRDRPTLRSLASAPATCWPTPIRKLRLGTQRGLSRTFLAPSTPAAGAGSDRITQPTGSAASHPYVGYELMNKIANSLTVRSNTFAIWMTVGFFEVVDDTTMPVTLGAEINRLENRHIRHRMFSIVDRTNLQAVSGSLKSAVALPSGQTYVDVPNFGSFLGAAASTGPASGASPVAIVANANPTLTNPNTNLQLTIQAGSVITVDPNTNNEETVTVIQSGGQLQARFYNPHNAGAAVIIRGNPGPWTQYDHRRDTSVVPYFAVID